MEINEFKKPASDEIEVTTISGGLNGESVVLHLGDDKWAIIDSCKGEGIKLPLPLYYLKELGVDFENVILIICTHWHSDHINGLVDVIKECENAKFVMGKIGNKKDFILRLLDPENKNPEEKKGIEETFVGCMKELSKRNTFLKYPEYALCNTSLYDDVLKGCPVKLTALSPSGLLYEDFDRDMIDESKESLSTNKEKKLYDLNLCSIALSLTVGKEQIILGADMERNDPLRKRNQFCVKNCEKYERYGWCNVLRASNIMSKNKRFGNIKLPHHASITGFCPFIWEGCSSVATSTLYTTGNRLPKSNMLRTYKPLVSEYYLASRHELNKPYEEGNLLGDVMNDLSTKPSTSAGLGVVCTRQKVFGTEWSVLLHGAACKVNDDVINDYMEIERAIDNSKPEDDTVFQVENKNTTEFMQNPLISVIVPIYNVEKYLDKCVQSILAQTYTNLEIFLVDDGSPDRCGEMCDEYARQDSRIKVIHKPNGGVSDARNAALDALTGEYIACVDGDDTVRPDYIETMYRLIVKYGCELAMANFVFDYDGKKTYSKEEYKEFTYTPIEAITELFYQGNFDDYPWCKLYHRSLFDGIRYPKGIIFEDTCVTYLIMYKCKKIAYCNKQVLNYMIRENSYEGAPFSDLKMDSAFAVFNSLGRDHADIVALVDKAYRCRMFTFACHLLLKMPQNYRNKEILWDKIKMYRWSVLLDNRANVKARLAALLSFLGINIMQFAFKLVDNRN